MTTLACSDLNAAPFRAFLPYASGAARTVSFQAEVNLTYPVDTTGAIIVTMPQDPQDGDRVGFVDLTAVSQAITLTVFPVGKGTIVQSTADTYAPGNNVSAALRSGGGLIWEYNASLDIWQITHWRPSAPPGPVE